MSRFPDTQLRLCFHNFDQIQLAGSFWGTTLKAPVSFSNAIDFIAKVDKAYNHIGRPQPTQTMRSFSEGSPYNKFQATAPTQTTPERLASFQGTLATFDLLMISRKSGEWQGCLKDKNGKHIGNFETSMACLALIETALTKALEAV